MTPPAARWAALGQVLRRRRRAIIVAQWLVVGFYAVLLLVPPLLPLPDAQSRIFNHLTVFAEFVFWGIWWPFVLLSMVVAGRWWCGVLCPEGALTEAASRVGLGRSIPRWMRWGGWPFVGFTLTTVYGQMVSVYQYPQAAALVLGGSTVAAVLVGLVYGKGKRVWCRHLCPVSGVFALLAKLSPLSYRTDQVQWEAYNRARRDGKQDRMPPPDCAPLIALKQLDSASDCHMCSRCSGYKGAIALTSRPLGSEVVTPPVARPPNVWEFVLIVYGLLGVAVGAFHWSASPWFVTAKQSLAVWLFDHGGGWWVETTTPWWLLTHYDANNDVFTLLDGACLVGYIALTAALLGSLVAGALAVANRVLGRWQWRRLYHLSYSLIPLAGVGVFLGLSMTTLALLKAEGLPLWWRAEARVVLMGLAAAWSAHLAWQVTGRYASGLRRGLAWLATVLCQAPVLGAWWLLFWGW
ncbi:4Fe-4S binding protein [Halomonas sp. V046]|uniref:4Fe-4S binding protein n=1 Tax=Halomonas sp. V046 TaxID=3459611 RepID=UPI00404446C8